MSTPLGALPYQGVANGRLTTPYVWHQVENRIRRPPAPTLEQIEQRRRIYREGNGDAPHRPGNVVLAGDGEEGAGYHTGRGRFSTDPP